MGLAMKQKKNKLVIKIEVSDGTFIASDNLFYDYGIGDSLKECLCDYRQTIKERLEITKGNKNKFIIYKRKILSKFLK
jgi:hypothetical protein